MNKKGFTLMELLAVIAVLSILIVFAVPNLVKLFNQNKNTLSMIQKRQIESATDMYITDYCIEPINDSYNCPSTLTTNLDSKGHIYVSSGSINLSVLGEVGYMNEKEILNNCDGTITISNGKINLDGITCNF